MVSRLTRRRLVRISVRLEAAREKLRVAEEQLAFLDEEAADLKVRSIVSDSPFDRRAAEEAQRSAQTAQRHRDRVAAEIVRLSATADDLLDSRLMKDDT